ncbi:MAG: alpha-L-rhamnosidase C-terminal domain-containing protein [Phycisphaerae bacterium]
MERRTFLKAISVAAVAVIADGQGFGVKRVMADKNGRGAAPTGPGGPAVISDAITAEAPALEHRMLPDVSPIKEPYPPLHGGRFSNIKTLSSPDPLIDFRWNKTRASDDLQAYLLGPVHAIADTPDAFDGLDTLTTPHCNVLVKGTGSIRLDFGVESAAWLEFDSPDFSGTVQMSISEFNAPPLPAAPGKTKTPIKYGKTFRLETNPELYEGVRFGWIHVRSFSGKPWHITAVRAVCQIKPTNYQGGFSCSDPMLTRIWYTAAYTVKLNLLKKSFGAILMDRGDRISWTGDAHIAQAAAMVAFGNWDSVRQNLESTEKISNGIATYVLYWVKSLLDYHRYTGDDALLRKYLPDAQRHLDQELVNYAHPAIGFYGSDERVGADFEYPQCREAKTAFRMLFIGSCRDFASAAAAIGRMDLHEKYERIAEAKIKELRTNSSWYEPFGIHACAEVINAGFATQSERQAIIRQAFMNRVDRLSYAPFNQFFILQAMARLGEFDAALQTIHDCWGGQVRYGGTTFFEVYRPSWDAMLKRNDPVPNCQTGYTSLCHPWSSGVAYWLTREVTGIKPTAPGFRTVDIVPNLGKSLTRVAGRTPIPHGIVEGSFDVVSGICRATVPSGVVARIGVPKAGRSIKRIIVNGQMAWNGTYHTVPSIAAANEDSDFVYFTGVGAGTFAMDVEYRGKTVKPVKEPLVYPAGFAFVKEDAATQGNWGGVYGRDGFVLFGYDGPGKDRSHLPDYVQSVTPSRGVQGGCRNILRASQTMEHRAPAPDSSNSFPRNVGCLQGGTAWSDVTMYLDVVVRRSAKYQLALYFVDWNCRGRKTAVEVFDLQGLNRATPDKLISDYAQGKYLVYECRRSVRIRINLVRGVNTVLSGIFFDPPSDNF